MVFVADTPAVDDQGYFAVRAYDSAIVDRSVPRQTVAGACYAVQRRPGLVITEVPVFGLVRSPRSSRVLPRVSGPVR